MTERKKLTALLNEALFPDYDMDELVSYLMDNGVTFCTAVPGHENNYDIAEMAYNNGYKKGYENGYIKGYENGKKDSVKCGHWKAYPDEYQICGTEFVCSNCNESFVNSELASDNDFLELMKYCPNCGADMQERK